MREDLEVGQLVARLQITGSQTEISTRLVYNSSEVKTNGTDYFTLNYTNLYLKYRNDEKKIFVLREQILNCFFSSS